MAKASSLEITRAPIAVSCSDACRELSRAETVSIASAIGMSGVTLNRERSRWASPVGQKAWPGAVIIFESGMIKLPFGEGLSPFVTKRKVTAVRGLVNRSYPPGRRKASRVQPP